MFIVAAIDLVYPQLSRYAIDSIIMQGDIKRLVPFAAVYFIVIALQSFGTVMFISRAGKLEMAIAYDIRQDAFKKLQELSFSYYDKTAVGYIMARMIGDIPRLSDMIAWSLTDILWSGGFVIGCTVMMLSMNWKLALLVLIVVPPIAILCAWFQKEFFSSTESYANRIPALQVHSTRASWARSRRKRSFVKNAILKSLKQNPAKCGKPLSGLPCFRQCLPPSL